MHVYIASEPGNLILRHCTILLSLSQTWFNQAPPQLPKKRTTHAAIKGVKPY